MSRDPIAEDLRRQATAAADLMAALNSADAEFQHDVIEGETNLLEAIESAIGEIDDCEIIVAGCKEKEDQIASRRHRATARVERLRGLIEQAMLVADQRNIRTATATLTVKDVKPKPFISDEVAIPADYWKQPDPVLDKAKLNKDANGGMKIPGVSMTNGGTSLQIRRA